MPSMSVRNSCLQAGVSIPARVWRRVRCGRREFSHVLDFLVAKSTRMAKPETWFRLLYLTPRSRMWMWTFFLAVGVPLLLSSYISCMSSLCHNTWWSTFCLSPPPFFNPCLCPKYCTNHSIFVSLPARVPIFLSNHPIISLLPVQVPRPLYSYPVFFTLYFLYVSQYFCSNSTFSLHVLLPVFVRKWKMETWQVGQKYFFFYFGHPLNPVIWTCANVLGHDREKAFHLV